MKKILLFILLLVLSLIRSYAQNKVFVKENGSITDSSKAKYYLTYQKLSDTAFLVKQFEMKGLIMTAGVYKDATLKIPNGRFFYYEILKKEKQQQMLKNNILADSYAKRISGKVDTSFLKTVGQYRNGIKTGLWTEYNIMGDRDFAVYYKNEKREGLYEGFVNDTVVLKGNYINDKREGIWLSSPKRKYIVRELYKNDEMIKAIGLVSGYKGATPPEKFEDYLKRDLADKMIGKNERIFISGVIDEDGKLKRPQVLSFEGDNDKDKEAILLSLANSPLIWSPAFEESSNKKEKEETLFLINVKDGNIHFEYTSLQM